MGKAGMTVDGPADQDYGIREASHVDPDGNVALRDEPWLTASHSCGWDSLPLDTAVSTGVVAGSC